MNEALIVVPHLQGSTMTGDQVVLRKVLAFLQQRFNCTVLEFARGSRRHGVAMMLVHRIPPGVAYYWDGAYRVALRRRWADKKFDAVFILHEGLFYLADELRGEKTTITLFAHNILSRFTNGSLAQSALTALARRYQRRWYRSDGVRLVLISKGDRDEAVRLGLAPPDAPVAPPGAPPSSPLSLDAVFSGEAIITGTYGWWRKRRDLESFAAASRFPTLIAFDPKVKSVAPEASILPLMNAFDWSSAIRAGIVTDRFGGGFKLKSLEYVARNCLVLSRAPIMAEFADLPHAMEFIIDRMDESQWPEHLSMLRNSDQVGLRTRFLEFKAACMARYDWATCLQPLVDLGFAGNSC